MSRKCLGRGPFALAVPLTLWLLLGPASAARADLLDYVKKPDKVYGWKLKAKTNHPEGMVYDLHLVSQEWQGIRWEHQLQVYLPTGVKPTRTMFLWNQGGKASAGSIAFGMDLAKKLKAPVAFLYHVPNQPLLGGKTEDALIAETFVRYLKTKDEDWPLLFPMVKSLVRAMDALQAFARQEWDIEVSHFVVSGGSKRGWTTWLTAAADARVKALAPLVIDTLNMKAQMPYQLRSFGKYSEQIRDYTQRGLVPMPDTPEARRLWLMVDPWAYRERLKQPALIVNGANDPYWTTDALNLYWDDLKNPRWVLYVPNAGHNLQQRKSGSEDRLRALNTLAAFGYFQIHGGELPHLRWQHTDAEEKLRVTVEAKTAPRAARLWVARAPTRDFRKATWEEQPAMVKGGTVQGEVTPPAEGFVAFFAEVDYEVNGLVYHLSTQMRIAGKGK
ncbi:MAG: PhoPQ-activated pathogenicity-related family protein [Gemmataceae bacterium]|nr:PhoPQ-activated pathogenicity-related family protein [Gemmataceae bacterium]